MNNIVKIALHKPTGTFMHVDNASNGLSCNCECLKCSEKLEAIQGEVRTKHFRHYSKKDCEGSQETALHELGKQILVQNQQIQVPEYGTIDYSDPVSEAKIKDVRPDVTATYDKGPIYFEVFVSNMVDEKKDKYIKANQLKTVEIDLSAAKTLTYYEIKHKVLDAVDNKRIIFWEPNSLKQTSDNSGCIFQLIIFIAVMFGLTWMISDKN